MDPAVEQLLDEIAQLNSDIDQAQAIVDRKTEHWWLRLFYWRQLQDDKAHLNEGQRLLREGRQLLIELKVIKANESDT